MFIAFRIPYSPAIGVKLISTPWTTSTCRTSRDRRRAASAGAPQQGHAGRPGTDPELAGQADVRILILDADAPVLPGLSLAGE